MDGSVGRWSRRATGHENCHCSRIFSGRSIIAAKIFIVVILWTQSDFIVCQRLDEQTEDVLSTPFTCQSKPPGYYADSNSNCKLYHMCNDRGVKYTYACPNGTLFHQKFFICAHSYSVRCSNTRKSYPGNVANHPPTKTTNVLRTSAVANNELSSRPSQVLEAGKQTNKPIKNRESDESPTSSKFISRNKQSVQRPGFILTERDFNYSKANNLLAFKKTDTANPVRRPPAVIRKVNVLKRNVTRRTQPVQANRSDKNSQNTASAQPGNPGTNYPKIIGVSVTSSVEAKTDRVPVLVISKSRTIAAQTDRQEQVPIRRSSVKRLPTRKNNPVPKFIGTRATTSRVTTPSPTDNDPYLTREEFFGKIEGLFGQRVATKAQKSSSGNNTNNDRNSNTSVNQFNQTLSRDQIVVKLHKNISINRTVLNTKTDRKIISKEDIPEQLIEEVKSDLKGTIFDKDVPGTSKTEDELVTGDYRQCPGCMKYFIQNIDNCFPCVNPR